MLFVGKHHLPLLLQLLLLDELGLGFGLAARIQQPPLGQVERFAGEGGESGARRATLRHPHARDCHALGEARRRAHLLTSKIAWGRNHQVLAKLVLACPERLVSHHLAHASFGYLMTGGASHHHSTLVSNVRLGAKIFSPHELFKKTSIIAL